MTTYEGKIVPWTAPDPFIVHFSNGGEIHFYKDGRTVGKLSNPDDDADEFVKFVEKHYRAHILEAERRAEQRVRAEIGRDSERLGNMREKLRIAKNGLLRVKEITGESSRAHQAADRALIQIETRSIDAAREVG